MKLTISIKALNRLLLGLFWCLILSACSKPSDTSSSAPTEKDTPASSEHQVMTTDSSLTHPANQQLTKIIESHLLALVHQAQTLNDQLIAFAKEPSEEALETTISALDTTHNIYVGGEFLRTCCFYGIEKAPPTENQAVTIPLNERLDQYPILPGYLDTVEGYPYSGLIHTDIPITKERMEQEFKLGDPNYVTLGFHALDVLLKGDTISRSASDFKALSSTDDTSTAPPELRRTLYAVLLSSEISRDLFKLKQTWSTNLHSKITLQSTEQAQALFAKLHLKAEDELNLTQEKQQELANSNITFMHMNSEILKEREKHLQALLAIELNP